MANKISLFSEYMFHTDGFPKTPVTASAGIMVQEKSAEFHGSFDNFRLMLILEGEAEYRDATLIPGDMLLRPPGIRHKFTRKLSSRCRWRELFITLSPEYFKRISEIGILPSGKNILRYTGELRDSFAKQQLMDFRQLKNNGISSLTSFLVLFQNNFRMLREPKNPGTGNSWADEAGRILREYIYSPNRKNYTGAAAKMGMNPETFRKKFKRETGISPGKFCTKAAAEEARSLLIQSDKSLSEIASYMGYSDEYSFGKQFRKETGESPGACRRRIKNM